MSLQLDKETFTSLLQEHKRIVFKICKGYCIAESDRDDLAQEIVYQLWKSFKTYNPSYKFTTWMYRIALNVAISFYRQGQSRKHKITYPEVLIDLHDNDDQDGDTEDKYQLMHRFISELKELDKSIMILFLDGKSYKEIAEITGISETNVSTRMGRIKETLRTKFSNHRN